jgi:RNA polymerase sigma-70 factor (ECF subfamily)
MTTINVKSMTRWRQNLDEDDAPIAESKINPAAFAVLYDRYVQPVYRYFYNRTCSAPEAEDLTSQTFLAALEALPRYQHQGNFAAWLFRIARSKVIDHIRKEQKLCAMDDSFPAEANDLLAQVVHADEVAHLAALVHRLNDDEQELIRLRYTVGLPFAQIAAILGSNENTVKKSLYRIVARLQSQSEDRSHA